MGALGGQLRAELPRPLAAVAPRSRRSTVGPFSARGRAPRRSRSSSTRGRRRARSLTAVVVGRVVEPRSSLTSSIVPSTSRSVVDRAHPRDELLLVEPARRRPWPRPPRERPRRGATQVLVHQALVVGVGLGVVRVGGRIQAAEAGSRSSVRISRIWAARERSTVALFLGQAELEVALPRALDPALGDHHRLIDLAASSPRGRARAGGRRRARPSPGCRSRPRPGPCGGRRASGRSPCPGCSRRASGGPGPRRT